MKNIAFLILSVFLITNSVTAQNGLTVSTTVNLYGGGTATNSYLEIIPYIPSLITANQVECDLMFYTSYASKVAGGSRIYPVVNSSRVIRCTLTVAPTDTVKSSGASTVRDFESLLYRKTKTVILSKYGLTAN
jgi:hypothetical protein